MKKCLKKVAQFWHTLSRKMELLNYEKLVKLLSIKGCEGREFISGGGASPFLM
jgi:hypothetical protein